MQKLNQISEKSTKLDRLCHNRMVFVALLTSAAVSSCSDSQTPVNEDTFALQTISMPRALRESCVESEDIDFRLEANAVVQPVIRQPNGWLVNLQVERGELLEVELSLSTGGVTLAALQRDFGVVNNSMDVSIDPASYTYPDDDADSASNLDEICDGTDPLLSDQSGPEDTQTSISFVSESYSVDEAAGSLDINLRRSGSSVGAIDIRITGRDGTAISGLDFDPGPYYVSWADGESGVKSATIIVLDDSEVEDDEVFEIVLVNQSNPSDITTFDRGTVATVTLSSDDVPSIDDDPDTPPYIPVTTDFPCGGEEGTDNDSSTSVWDDNCTIRRGSAPSELLSGPLAIQPAGQFADSLYTVGIQRVLYCTGFGTGNSYIDFATGVFDQATEDAVREFQRSGFDPLPDDGVVGPQTWAKLRSALEVVELGTLIGTANGIPTTEDLYGFLSGRCRDIPLFYQVISFDTNGSEIPGRWYLAGNVPDDWIHIPFSIGTPFESF